MFLLIDKHRRLRSPRVFDVRTCTSCCVCVFFCWNQWLVNFRSGFDFHVLCVYFFSSRLCNFKRVALQNLRIIITLKNVAHRVNERSPPASNSITFWNGLFLEINGTILYERSKAMIKMHLSYFDVVQFSNDIDECSSLGEIPLDSAIDDRPMNVPTIEAFRKLPTNWTDG